MKDKSRIITIEHTITNEQYRGNGLAAMTTEYLFQYALKNNYNIASNCWYTHKFIQQNDNDEYMKIFIK